VRLLGVSISHTPWLTVLEYLKYGDLRSVLKACKSKGVELSYAEQLHFSVQLASGLAFMSSNVSEEHSQSLPMK
jgi:hypothetical protein